VAIDFVGTLSFVVPGVGEFADVVWAPVSAALVKALFGSTLFAGLNLAEELLPGLDFIPTATIAWGSKFRPYAALLLAALADLKKILGQDNKGKKKKKKEASEASSSSPSSGTRSASHQRGKQ